MQSFRFSVLVLVLVLVLFSVCGLMAQEGLVAFYPFNASANDESGYGNHGSVNGATLTYDRFNNTNGAYAFDGVNDQIIIPDNPQLAIDSSESATVSYWLRHASSNRDTYVISKFSGIVGQYTSYAFGTGSTGNAYSWHELTPGSGQENRGNINLSDGRWHFVVSVFASGESISTYIDGEFDVSNSISFDGSIANPLDLYIGSNTNSYQYYHGRIDDIRVYNRSITENEIDSLYHLNNWNTQSSGTVTDIDGNVYTTITIGNQEWMAENLRVTHYQNGDAITKVLNASTWTGLSEGAYCNYDNNDNDVLTHGSLYNWHAAADSRNIAPEGWHVPTDAELNQMEMYIGMSQSEAEATGFRGTDEGTKLKSINGWNGGGSGTDEYGFTALPAGLRSSTSGNYEWMGSQLFLWASSEYSGTHGWYHSLPHDHADINRSPDSKYFGFSIRCVKDAVARSLIHVPDDYATIQAGIDAAVDGDTVLVQPGTYIENINFNGKNIVVGSLFLTTQDTSYISQTVIDGNQSGSVVSFVNNENSSAVFTGFSITNGSGTYNETNNRFDGGGLYINYASPTINNLNVFSNIATLGAGIFCYSGNNTLHLSNSNIHHNNSADCYFGGGVWIGGGALLENLMVSDNSATYAAGIYLNGSNLVFKNSIIRNNSAIQDGGGIYINTADPLFENLLIHGNSAGTGGGILCGSANPTIKNCTIIGNSIPAPDGSIYFGGGIRCDGGSHPDITNSILWNNEPKNIGFDNWGDPTVTVRYSDIGNGLDGIEDNDNGIINWLEGNIVNNPKFVGSSVDDYSLQASSLCINSGQPDLTDPDGTRSDMGAYPYLNSYTGPDWHVTADGDDVAGIGTPENPFASIQAGINFASISDSILVDPGTYSGTANFLGKDIYVVGIAGREETIIDGAGAFNILTFANGESRNAVLDGFTIQNGRSDWQAYHTEGAIYISSSSPTIKNCIIQNCEQYYYGAAIGIWNNSSPLMDNLIIRNNLSYHGGAIAVLSGNPILRNTLLHNNHSTGTAGAIYSDLNGQILRVENCTIVSNTADGLYNEFWGGGVFAWNNETVEIINSIFWSNIPNQIQGEDTISVPTSYSNIEGGFEGVGNQDIAPLFVNFESHDYRLKANSFSINAGHPDSTDLDGTRADMGAYPYLNSYSGPNWYVDVIGDDISGTGAMSNPFASIQAGINFADNGDSISVGAGTYNENIDFRGRAITVQGSAGAQNTVIDGSGLGSVVRFNTAETNTTKLTGFTITNGHSYNGGGIYLIGASPALEDLYVTNNIVDYQGGGIYAEGSNSTIKSCTISNNHSPNLGGGLLIYVSPMEIINTEISQNSASYGGGICIAQMPSPTLTNVLITNNTALNYGGGLLATASAAPSIINSTIANNSSILNGGGLRIEGGNTTVLNSILFYNSPQEISYVSEPGIQSSISLSHSNIEGGLENIETDDNGTVNWLPGNINSDPRFVNPNSSLYNLADISPALGAGLDTSIVPLTDLEGNLRPNPAGSNPDIGAYESPLAEPIVVVEVQNLHIGGSEGTLHLISHNPLISYSYYNSLEEPLGFHQIQVSSLSDFSLIDKWDTYTVINPDTMVTYTGNALVDGETYYLRVKAGSGDIWTDWEVLSFRMNSIPPSPVLLSPIENTVIADEAHFIIQNSQDAELDSLLYQFYLYEDLAMTTLVDSSELIEQGLETSSWTSTSDLSDNNQYWWTARVYDGYEFSSLTSPASFLVNTDNAPPEPFVLIYPLNDIELSSLTPTFSWHTAVDVDPDDVVSYELYLDTPEPGVEVYELGSDTLFQPPAPLLDNTSYFWRVVAKDILGFETNSIGDYRKFTVNLFNDNPSVVDLITPDSVMVLTLTPHMVWSPATDIDPGDVVSYEMHWWAEGLDLDSVLTDTNAVILPRELADNTQYFWEVIAMDDSDGISHSIVATFWTDLFNEVPVGFALLSPENGATGLSQSPAFLWEFAADPDPFDYATYTFQISTDSAFTDITYETNTSVNVGFEMTEDLPMDNEYWWRVIATDRDSLSTESETFKFTVGFVSITESIALPTEYVLQQNYPNPFNPSTTLRFGIPEEANVSLTIYDIRGNTITTIDSGSKEAGWYQYVWNGLDDSGRPISTGLYLTRLQAGSYTKVIKMLYLK